MTLVALFIFSSALIADSVSPGPTVAALIARVLSQGVRGVLPFLAAIWLGEAIWLSAAMAGLTALAVSFSLLFNIVKWLGVIYLFYLSWTMITHKEGSSGVGDGISVSGSATFFSGLAVSIGNPKNMIFYLTLLPSIIDMQVFTLVGWLELTATLLVTLIVIDVTWVLLAAKARRIIQDSRAIRRINQISGAAMALAATAIAAR